MQECSFGRTLIQADDENPWGFLHESHWQHARDNFMYTLSPQVSEVLGLDIMKTTKLDSKIV